MPAIELRTNEGELLGFLLIAGDIPIHEISEPVDSIFTGVPERSTLFDHLLGSLVQNNKHVEQKSVIQVQDGDIVLNRPVLADLDLQMEIGADGSGAFQFNHADGTAELGRCRLIQATES